MALPRVFLGFETVCEPGSVIELGESDSRHLIAALRLHVDDPLEVVHNGRTFDARLVNQQIPAHVRILTPRPRVDTLGPIDCLYVALLKGERNDRICDWATELGASRIVFFQAERSIVRLDSADALKSKELRFQKIVHAAAKQSRSDAVPEVLVFETMENCLQTPGGESVRLLCSLDPAAMHIAKQVETAPRARFSVLVGPEGDLSPAEHSLCTAMGFRPVRLGARVLRSELAALTAITTILGLSELARENEIRQ